MDIGRVDKAYISSYTFMDRPDIMREVLDTTIDELTVLDIMEQTGRMVVTDNPVYQHLVNQSVFTAGVIADIDVTTDGQSAGESIIITVSAADQLPIVGENVMFTNKRIGAVTSIDKGNLKFTAKPLSSASGDILNPSGTSVADGQMCIYFTGAFGEGSLSSEGRRPKWTETKNTIQIFKEYAKITDLQKVSKIEVNYNGQPYVMYKLQHDTLLRHRAKIAYGLMAGKQRKWVDADGNDVYMTQGLINYLLEGDGVTSTVGAVKLPLSGSTIDKAKLRTLNRALDKKGSPAEFWWWVGGDLWADLDDVLLTLDQTKQGILYNSWGRGDGKQRALDFGVDSFKIYGRTAHVKKIAAFDHEEVFGATGFDFAKHGLLIPQGKVKIDKSSNQVDRLRVRYMSGDGDNLKHIETVGGKLAPKNQTDEAVLWVSYQSVMGMEALGIEQFGIITP